MVETTKKEACMKKIVIDARESGTSTGRYIDSLIKYLHEFNPPYELVLLAKNHRIDYLKKIAPKFKVIESNFKEFTFAEQLGLLKQIKELKPDLVHFGAIHQPVLYRGKSVTTVHDLTTARFRNPTKNWLIFTIKQNIYKCVIKRVAHNSTAIVTPTDYVKNDLASYAKISDRKITVTHEAAEDLSGKAEPIAGIAGKDFIIFNGRPLPHKNLYRVIEAYELLRQKYPQLLLVIAGRKDASFKSYLSFVRKLKLENSIVFTDYIPDSQLKWAFQNTKAYVYASLSEGFGLPGLEAMHYGAPLVSSNATCLPEVYGDAAHYFDPTNVNDMAEKIDEVLSSPKLQEELIEKGKKQVKKYSWRRMAEQTLDVYNEVLEKNT
jgi:glycosyltransferase involved in cell wall biosynthesis